MSRKEEILQKEFDSNPKNVPYNEMYLGEKESILNAMRIYANYCCVASLEKAKKDLYNYWIFFEEGKQNSPEFIIKVEDPAKVYNSAFDTYGPQVEDLFYSCVSHEESITNKDNIILL